MENNKPQIRFKGFDEDWEEKKLSEIADIIGGGTPSTGINEFWNGDIDWYSPSEIGKNIFANGSVKKITGLGLENSSAKILPANKTILFTSRAGIGDMAILSKEGATNQGFQSLVLKNGNNTYFIYSSGFLIKKYALSKASGSTFLEISSKILGNMDLPIPKNQTEQNQIGTFFENLDKLLIEHQQKHSKLKELKKAMLAKMFPQPEQTVPEIRFKGFSGDWEEKTLGEVANFRRGSFPQPYGLPEWYDDENGMPFIQVFDVDENMRLKPFTKSKISELGSLYSVFINKGTLVVTIQGSIGRVAKTQYDAFVDRTLLIFQSYKAKIYVDYFKYVVFLLFEIEKTKAPGGTIKTITKEVLTDFKIHLPCFEEQKKIGDYFENLDSLISNHQTQIEKLQNIKKAFSTKMFI